MSRFTTQPLYLQVRDALAGRIAAGEWKAGTAIPNETDLARDLGVSPGTMRKALDMLESDGLVNRRQGRGTFVNDPTSPELAERYNNLHGPDGKRIAGTIKVLEVTDGVATETESSRLRLAQGQRVYRINSIRTSEGKPYLTEMAVLPDAIFPRLTDTDLCSRGVVTIAHAYGLWLGGAIECVSLTRVSHTAAEVLSVAEDSPIFVLDRIIKTHDGRPAEWRRAECKTNGVHYKSAIN